MIARSVTLLCLVLAACEHESSSVPERRDPVIVAQVSPDASIAPVMADAATVKEIVDAAPEPPKPPVPPKPGAPSVGLFTDANRKVLDQIIDKTLTNGTLGTFSGTTKGTAGTGASTTANDIDRKIKEHAGQFKACYTKELAKGRDIGGKVKLSFTISGTGAVTKATATGMDAAVEDCIVRVVKGIKFEASADGKPANITYPLIFSGP